MKIVVTGPRERGSTPPDAVVVDTTSRSATSWSRAFSPFYLGPVDLYDGHVARTLENGWQYAKVYADQLGADGNPNEAYWAWAKTGWGKMRADRYPQGKGAKPVFCWWNGQKLRYIEARLKVYFPLYRDAVRKTEAFNQLVRLARDRTIVLWDFDGFDHQTIGLSLANVLLDDSRPMGHAFVLKAMLLYGPDVTPEMVLADSRQQRKASPQFQLL